MNPSRKNLPSFRKISTPLEKNLKSPFLNISQAPKISQPPENFLTTPENFSPPPPPKENSQPPPKLFQPPPKKNSLPPP